MYVPLQQPVLTGSTRDNRLSVRVAIAAVLAGLPTLTWAQTGVAVAGFVENESGTLVPYATLTLLSADARKSHMTMADMLGRFSFRNIAPDSYVLEARAQGYKAAEVAVAVGTERLVGLRITVNRERAVPSSLGSTASMPTPGNPEVGKLAGTSLPPVVESVTAGLEPALPLDISATEDGQPDSAVVTETTATAKPEEPPDGQIPSAPGAQGGLPTEPVDSARPPRLWSVGLNVSSVYESNIDHTSVPERAYGLVYGTGFSVQSARRRPLLQVGYELAAYQYPNVNRWTRLSHYINADIEKRVNSRLTVDSLVALTVGTTSEDQELSNEFIVSPRLGVRLPRDHRIRFYTAYRLRRPPDLERHATNLYAGVELQQRLESGNSWGIGLRYEENRAIGPRKSYVRLTYETAYSTALTTSDSVELRVKYRHRRYPYRLVEVDDIDVPRQEHRWIPAISWVHRFGTLRDFYVEYSMEAQSSNDLDQEYTAHYTAIGFRHRF
jgi:hypothetical protein